MTLFEQLNTILYSKTHTELNCDDESQFILFMINRWSSMYSPQIALAINETTNKNYSIFTTKQDAFNYLFYILPKLKFKRLNYIKKTKTTKEKEEPLYIPEFSCEREHKASIEFAETLSK